VSRHRSIWPLVLLAISLVPSWPSGAEEPSSARGEMRLTRLEGAATVAPAAGGEPRPLAVGAVLREGDRVATGPGARLEIAFGSGSVVRLGESTQAELRAAPVGGGQLRLKLAVGNLWARVTKLLVGERFEVETENAVAGVRGTEFRVESAGASGEDLIRVYEGRVRVEQPSARWGYDVGPDHELRFSRARAPISPEPFLRASEKGHPFMDWVREKGNDAARPPKATEPREPREKRPERERPQRKRRD
jgi:ferric-dicitrate binding protein FerR (iron transport regulator)